VLDLGLLGPDDHLREPGDLLVLRITADLAVLADTATAEAQRVLSNARRALSRQGAAASDKLRRAVADLETLVERTGKIIVQTRTRLAGQTPPGASRLVSLHDPDARPIVKGRLGKPVEFGSKAQVTDNADGLVLNYDLRSVTGPTLTCSCPPSNVLPVGSARSPARSPRTAATARPASTSS